MARFPKPNEICPDFFGGIDRQCIARRAILHTTNQNADDFALEIKKRCASFAALRRQIYPQVGRGEITAEIFTIESGDHAEAWSFGEIEWVANRHDRSG